MTTQQFNAAAEVHALKQQRMIARQRRVSSSALTKHRGEIVALLKAGASFRLVARWLKRNKHVYVSHTTIMRFAKKLPELKTNEAKSESENNLMQNEKQREVNHAQLS